MSETRSPQNILDNLYTPLTRGKEGIFTSPFDQLDNHTLKEYWTLTKAESAISTFIERINLELTNRAITVYQAQCIYTRFVEDLYNWGENQALVYLLNECISVSISSSKSGLRRFNPSMSLTDRFKALHTKRITHEVSEWLIERTIIHLFRTTDEPSELAKLRKIPVSIISSIQIITLALNDTQTLPDLKGSKVLDVGCGSPINAPVDRDNRWEPYWCYWCAARGAQTYGIDKNPLPFFRNPPYTHVVLDILEVVRSGRTPNVFEHDDFDLITFQLNEFATEKHQMLDWAMNKLKEGGILIWEGTVYERKEGKLVQLSH